MYRILSQPVVHVSDNFETIKHVGMDSDGSWRKKTITKVFHAPQHKQTSHINEGKIYDFNHVIGNYFKQNILTPV